MRFKLRTLMAAIAGAALLCFAAPICWRWTTAKPDFENLDTFSLGCVRSIVGVSTLFFLGSIVAVVALDLIARGVQAAWKRR